MKGRNLLILAALVLAVAAYIFLVERHRPSSDEAEEQAQAVIPDLDTDQVTAIRLEGGPEVVRLERRGDAWRLTQPLDFAADSSRVNTLLSSLANLKAERRVPAAEVAPAELGLESPAYTVLLEGADGELARLAIGDEAPLGAERAVRLAGADEIVYCRSWFVSDLDRPVDDWRSRDVVELAEEDVASLEVDAPAGRIRAVRVADGWRLLEPVEDLGDRDHLRNVVSDLNAMRIQEFVDGDVDLGALGLDAPRFEVMVVRADGGEPVRLALGAEQEVDGATRVACRRGDSEYFWVNDLAAIRLSKAPVLWRAQTVYPFDTWDVDRFVLSRDGETVDLDRSSGAWAMADGSAAAFTEVQDRLAKLAALDVADFDLVEPPTPEMGRVELELGRPDGDDASGTTVSFTFHRPLAADGNAMVKVSARSTVVSVATADLEEILGDLAALRAAPASDEPSEEQPES